LCFLNITPQDSQDWRSAPVDWSAVDGEGRQGKADMFVVVMVSAVAGKEEIASQSLRLIT